MSSVWEHLGPCRTARRSQPDRSGSEVRACEWLRDIEVHQAGDVGGHHGRAPGFGDEGHGAEVVELIGLGLIDGVVNGVLVSQIAVEEVELIVAHQVVDEAATGSGLRTRRTNP